MSILQTYGKEIISILVPFLTWFLNVGLKGKAKLIWTASHSFSFLINEPHINAQGQQISPLSKAHTKSISVINTGKQSSTKVELIFNWTPQYLNVWPVRHYETKTELDRRHILIFENLSPKESIGLEMLSVNTDLPDLLFVRSAECTAQQHDVMWIPAIQRWKIKLATIMMLIGAMTSLYLLIALIQILVLRTPLVV